MTPLEIVKYAYESGTLILEIEPGLSESEIAEFAASLPCPLPSDIRDLLAYCAGFDDIDFTRTFGGYVQEDIFPFAIRILGDGAGNFWVVDLTSDSTTFGPIYFACHDNPVILYQSPDLRHFLMEIFSENSSISDVNMDRLYNVWEDNPGVLSWEEALSSNNPELVEFANSLDSTFKIIDLRNAPIGMGFSWGRYGSNTVVKRHGNLPIFAYQKTIKLGLWDRIMPR